MKSFRFVGLDSTWFCPHQVLYYLIFHLNQFTLEWSLISKFSFDIYFVVVTAIVSDQHHPRRREPNLSNLESKSDLTWFNYRSFVLLPFRCADSVFPERERSGDSVAMSGPVTCVSLFVYLCPTCTPSLLSYPARFGLLQ